MTIIVFRLDNKGGIAAIMSSGHSGFANEGQDIVCSAISVLLQTAIFSLQTQYQPEIQYSLEDGYLSFILPEYEVEQAIEVQAIMRHTLLGLMNLAASYRDYIQLSIQDGIDWLPIYNSLGAAAVLKSLGLIERDYVSN